MRPSVRRQGSPGFPPAGQLHGSARTRHTFSPDGTRGVPASETARCRSGTRSPRFAISVGPLLSVHHRAAPDPRRDQQSEPDVRGTVSPTPHNQQVEPPPPGQSAQVLPTGKGPEVGNAKVALTLSSARTTDSFRRMHLQQPPCPASCQNKLHGSPATGNARSPDLCTRPWTRSPSGVSSVRMSATSSHLPRGLGVLGGAEPLMAGTFSCATVLPGVLVVPNR
jgi:hypothetical protein